MTTGRIFPKIISFAIPIILTNYLQLLYGAADLVVVGRYAGHACLAAVGATGSTTNLLLNLFIGLSVGAGVVFANAYGAQNREMCHRTVHTSMAVSAISGVFIAVVAILLAEPMLVMQKVPDDVLPLSILYIRIFFAGSPFNLIYNFGASILRASGDTKRPLYFLALSGMINVILNLLFVLVFGMTVDGVALATVISQIISAVLVVLSLMKNEGYSRYIISKTRIYKEELIKILKIGIPSGLNGVIFSVSNLLIQTSINTFNKVAMAGVTAASSIEGFTYHCMVAFSQAAGTFSGQKHGAKKYSRMKPILLNCLLLASLSGLVVAIISYIFGGPLLGIYLKDSPDAVYYGMLRLELFAFTYFLHGMAEVYLGMLRGWGRSFGPAMVSLFSHRLHIQN